VQPSLPVDLTPRTWGGKRAGAGRKRLAARATPAHRRRPTVSRHHPLHVVMRVCPEVGRLRRRRGYAALRKAIATTLSRPDFRVVHVSIQHDHVHLIVEADDRRALTRGMRGLAVASARQRNAVLAREGVARRGQVFAARYHATAIRSPRQARSCLAYVLNNWRHHREHLVGSAARRARLDPYSTAVCFDGWLTPTGRFPIPDGYEPLAVAPPTTWLLTTGWRVHPPIDPHEIPGPPRS
jgi:REP element-mobilizing transposase RayT